MNRFYSNTIQGNRAVLSGAERDHCIRVLRTSVGDAVEIVNGSGGLAVGRLVSSSKQDAVVELETDLETANRQPSIIIASAVPKQPSRWEYFLEKATETGVDTVIPLVCRRSEKTNVRMDRSRQVILSAFKQSKRLFLPGLFEPVRLEELFVKQPAADERFIACLPHSVAGADESPFLGVKHKGGKTSIVLIGPEGDFTAEEISLAVQSGYSPVSLGEHRLRVETAALTACSILKCIDQLS